MKSNKLLSFLMSGLFALSSSGVVNNVLAMNPPPPVNAKPTPMGFAGLAPVPAIAFTVNCEECGKQPVPDGLFALYCQESNTKWYSYFCPNCFMPVKFSQIEGNKEVLNKLAKLNTTKLAFVKGFGALAHSPVALGATIGGPLMLGLGTGVGVGYAIRNHSAKKELAQSKANSYTPAQIKANSFTMNRQVSVQLSGSQR